MIDYTRYAIYYAPPEDSPLTRFGARWLGRSLNGTNPGPRPAIDGLDDADCHEATKFPRRYGFHGTLKAPFRLADGKSRTDLTTAVAALAESAQPARCGPLALTALGQFLALCPTADLSDLSDLASRIVRELEPLRAPLTADERARRRPERLSARQRDQLDAFGYPYIFDDFRFHLTLTGPLDDGTRDTIAGALAPLVAPFSDHPFVVDSVCVFGDPGDGAPFDLIERFPLAS